MGTTDPLGFGLQFWEAQFYPPELAGPLRRALVSNAGSALNPRHFALPFRLYGGILGARLSGEAQLAASAEALLARRLPEEEKTRCGEEEHSAINKVMFASALLPEALARFPDEELIKI
eukprot:gnl/TRDRNA2_/TRDRNA2_61865_c1_seq1.p1 gnl/TRDRNA2_/TRDRNA2_61865_c1~~gnl/TRDRNA2_/TRDRNA2_61865_c1_seq1.p1  ORF type:complete len:133 (-),score=21.90 gnl/TRDRNA2_/TRDRNA2_61865_c1_seq1:161-517(-)